MISPLSLFLDVTCLNRSSYFNQQCVWTCSADESDRRIWSTWWKIFFPHSYLHPRTWFSFLYIFKPDFYVCASALMSYLKELKRCTKNMRYVINNNDKHTITATKRGKYPNYMDDACEQISFCFLYCIYSIVRQLVLNSTVWIQKDGGGFLIMNSLFRCLYRFCLIWRDASDTQLAKQTLEESINLIVPVQKRKTVDVCLNESAAASLPQVPSWFLLLGSMNSDFYSTQYLW